MSSGTLRPHFDLRHDLWKVLAAFGLLAVANLGFYLFLNLPRLRALGALRDDRDEVRQALLAARERSDTMLDLVTRYDDDVVKLDDFFTNRIGSQAERMTSIQKEIRAIASEFRIDPEAIDYTQSDVESSDLTQFQITIPLLGGYSNLRQFLNRIEAADHIFIVDSVELSGSREGGVMLSLTIRISTYFSTPERDTGHGRAKPVSRGA